MEEPKDPAGDVLMDLYRLIATESEIAQMEQTYRTGGFGYGEVKKALADASERYWAPYRDARQQWAANPKRVREILGDGAAKARTKARMVLSRAQQACGVTDW
jgi:tryptophanyl-tRNA synthetase